MKKLATHIRELLHKGNPGKKFGMLCYEGQSEPVHIGWVDQAGHRTGIDFKDGQFWLFWRVMNPKLAEEQRRRRRSMEVTDGHFRQYPITVKGYRELQAQLLKLGIVLPN